MYSLKTGQTPAKQLTGIKAVNRHTGQASWGITFVREAVKTALHLVFVGFLADTVLLLLDDDSHRSMMDRLFDTVVIDGRERDSNPLT